ASRSWRPWLAFRCTWRTGSSRSRRPRSRSPMASGWPVWRWRSRSRPSRRTSSNPAASRARPPDEEPGAGALGPQTGGRQRVRSSAKRAEGGPDLFREELRLLPRGEVAAPVGFVEIDQVWVDLLRPAAGRLEDLAGEDGECNRERELRGLRPGCDRGEDG